MHTKSLVAAGAAALALSIAGAASAHHSFGAEFDANSPVTLDGEVVMFEWVNPHSWIHLDAVNPETGEVERWRIEGGAPSPLLRRGWNRNSLPAGTHIIVTGFRSRDGDNRANGTSVTFPDGRELSLASSGEGAATAAERQGRE